MTPKFEETAIEKVIEINYEIVDLLWKLYAISDHITAILDDNLQLPTKLYLSNASLWGDMPNSKDDKKVLLWYVPIELEDRYGLKAKGVL